MLHRKISEVTMLTWEMTMFHQNLRPFVTFWGNTVINFSMEHGHFSNFCGAWSFLKFCRNMVVSIFFWWSMVAFQIFWWSMVVCQIFVEHGRFSNFGGTLSFLLFLVEHGPFSNFLAPVISLSLVTNMLLSIYSQGVECNISEIGKNPIGGFLQSLLKNHTAYNFFKNFLLSDQEKA